MSNSSLDELMALLSPAKRVAEVDEPIRAARESFVLPSIRMTDNAEVVTTLARFYAHLVTATGCTAPCDEECRVQVCGEVDASYPGGISAAAAAATSGLGGGLPRVLDLLTEHILAHAQRHYLHRHFICPNDPNDWHARLALATAYVERYGEALFGSAVPRPERLAHEFEKVLCAHMAFMERNNLLVPSG